MTEPTPVITAPSIRYAPSPRSITASICACAARSLFSRRCSSRISAAVKMDTNGAGAAEKVDLTANGNRLRFTRDVASITMDTHGVERVDFNALGGADVVFVSDLTGTGVTDVNVDLAGTLGGATGDGQADSVIVDGTNGNDTINVRGDASGVAVSGLAALVAIQHQEPNDGLAVDESILTGESEPVPRNV